MWNRNRHFFSPAVLKRLINLWKQVGNNLPADMSTICRVGQAQASSQDMVHPLQKHT